MTICSFTCKVGNAVVFMVDVSNLAAVVLCVCVCDGNFALFTPGGHNKKNCKRRHC